MSIFTRSKDTPPAPLKDVFADSKLRFGNDLGAIVCGLYSELEDRVDALEQRIARLEAKKR
jgi:hypothetical protein